MKPIRFDRHTKRRMAQRGISPGEVEAALRHPEQIEPSIKGRVNAFAPGAGGTVRVTYRESPNEILVVTVVRQRSGGEGKP